MAVHETSSSGRISKRIITVLGRGSAGHAGPALRVEMTWLALLHLGLHAAVPGGIALLFFRPNWKRAWLIMLSTMMVDLDHLLADPIYDPARCGIGFHPLHTYPAIAAYALMLVPRVTRLMALGLIIHMALDALDCVWK
jgi:hypothetical protein